MVEATDNTNLRWKVSSCSRLTDKIISTLQDEDLLSITPSLEISRAQVKKIILKRRVLVDGRRLLGSIQEARIDGLLIRQVCRRFAVVVTKIKRGMLLPVSASYDKGNDIKYIASLTVNPSGYAAGTVYWVIDA